MSEPSPTQLLVPTNDPGACEAEHKARGWNVGNLYVLKFYPSMQQDLIERTLYAMSFWRAEAEKQPELFQ